MEATVRIEGFVREVLQPGYTSRGLAMQALTLCRHGPDCVIPAEARDHVRVLLSGGHVRSVGAGLRRGQRVIVAGSLRLRERARVAFEVLASTVVVRCPAAVAGQPELRLG